MKMFRLPDAEKFSLTFLCLTIVLVAALEVILASTFPVVAQGATVGVDPVNNIADLSESSTVDVTITGVTDLFSYEVKVGYNPGILEAVSIEEGPFIKDQTKSPLGTLFSTIYGDDFVYAVCVTVGRYPGISGSGNLFKVTFSVKDSGESPLHVYDSILLDSTGAQMSHDTADGILKTRTPVASFRFTPDTEGRPLVGENVTFDAKDSYDPDGTIVEYSWDFGDGTNKTLSAPNATATHLYSEVSTPSAPYNVSLTVTDNEGRSSTKLREIHVKFHDIAILDIDAPDEVIFHSTLPATIDVTVLNNGSHSDNFKVAAYYDSNLIGTETRVAEGGVLESGKNETISLDWYTYINSSFTSSSNMTISGNWIHPSNVSASDGNYTYCNTNNTRQEYAGYSFNTAGWSGISKVEVGIEVKTDTGGNDQIEVTVSPDGGTSWGKSHIYDIATTTDRFFWVDVTGNLRWSRGSINRTRVRMKYLQRGIEATPIYVDWLRVRVSPLNPTDVPQGTYALWATAFLVDYFEPYEFREGEEADIADNTLFSDPIRVTIEEEHDMAVTNVEVSPTEIAFGTTSTVKVTVENRGNVEEVFDVELYANSTEPVAKERELRLLPGRTDTSIRFSWYEANDTAVEGTYNITVYIPPVVDELPENQTNNVISWAGQMRLLPVASFTVSPNDPALFEEVTFDASASYAPGEHGGTIDSYEWDFGDGTNSVGQTVTHTYRKPGTYSVELTVMDNENLNGTGEETVIVPAFSSTITISASPETVPVGFNTTISGSIKDVNGDVRANVAAALDYKRFEETVWLSLANVSTNDNGQYSVAWAPQEPGAYQIKASWPGDATTLSAESSVLSVNAAIQDIAVMDVVVSKVRVTKGESLTINVIASNKGTATESFNVSVYYNNTRLTRALAAPLAPGTNETISLPWNTQAIEEGSYIVKAVAEPLPAETYVADNSRTSGVFIQESSGASLDIFLYATIGLAIGIVALAGYLVKILKFK